MIKYLFFVLFFLSCSPFELVDSVEDKFSEVNGNGELQVDRNRSTATLLSFSSCGELLESLQASLMEEMKIILLSIKYDDGNFDALIESNVSVSEGDDCSVGNNQEALVEKADFVKINAHNMYLLNGNNLEIFTIPELGQLEKVSSINIEGFPSEMLVVEDKVVVFSLVDNHKIREDHPLKSLSKNENVFYRYRVNDYSKITVLDTVDKDNPEIIREFYLEGRYQDARKIDSSIRMVSYALLNFDELRYSPELTSSYYLLDGDDPKKEELFNEAVKATIRYNNAIIEQSTLRDFLPNIYEIKDAINLIEHSFDKNFCNNFISAVDSSARGITSILSLDLLSNNLYFDDEHIVSNGSLVYSSKENLIIAEYAQPKWWFWNNADFSEAENIHVFDIKRAGKTLYTGSVRVEGLIYNQFSISEYEGYIRVATTTGSFRSSLNEEQKDQFDNNIYVLALEEDGLKIKASVLGIATGEKIWTVRFVDNRGYLITYKRNSPLYTVDLSDPSNPYIIGEVSVTNLSTYINPISDKYLLTIGYDLEEDGLNYTTQLSIFDVSDFSSPNLSHYLSLKPEVEGDGWSHSYSEVIYRHKAIQYFEEKSILAVPISAYRYIDDYYDENRDNKEEPESSGYQYLSQLQLINVDEDDGLSIYGSIDHSNFFNGENTLLWEYRGIQRSIIMGDYIYVISDKGITVHKTSDLSLQTSHSLEGYMADHP
jgi:uncharacterized secreted protein with C-terminal beta-propeller domain